MSEPMTLYKLMILYLLKQVNSPLTEERISDFFLSHEYTNYFTLKQAISELSDAGLIHLHPVQNTTRIRITQEGEQTLGFFGKRISAEIIADMDQFLKENRFQIRSEVGITADYFQTENQDYCVRLEINEGKSKIISLELAAPDEKQAVLMCSRWKDSCQEIYGYLLKKLLGGES